MSDGFNCFSSGRRSNSPESPQSEVKVKIGKEHQGEGIYKLSPGLKRGKVLIVNFKEFESLQTAVERQQKTLYKQQLAEARQKGKEAKAAKAKAKAKGKAKAKAKANGGKGRGRGKGRGKGKAKGKGKAHALGRRWLKRRRLEGALQDLLAIFAASLVYTNSWVCFRASVCTGIHCNS